MTAGYNPQVNDYVVWTTEVGQVHQGWVYFVASEAEQKKGWQTPATAACAEFRGSMRRPFAPIFDRSPCVGGLGCGVL